MVSKAGARPSHYEALGLDASASDEEIARAFARRVSVSRPMAEMAQIGLAYEVLRNPVKRRAYDESLGLTRKPQLPNAPAQLNFRISARFEGLNAAEPLKPAFDDQAPKPALPLVPELEALAVSAPTSERTPKSENAVEPRQKPEIPEFLIIRQTRGQGSRDAGGHTIDWKYPAFALGSVFLGVALLGVWAGMSAGGDAADAQAEPAATVALPAARPHPNRVEAVVAPQLGTSETQPHQSTFVPARRIARAVPPHGPGRSEDRLTEISQSLERDSPPAPSSDQSTAADQSAPAVAASLPLPNHVVARTIERIGYRCGEIASTTAVEGDAPGVYKVTCTSGQSYQASPVRGRYRFRRLER